MSRHQTLVSRIAGLLTCLRSENGGQALQGLALALVLPLTCVPSVFAQTREAMGVPADVRAAQEFLMAAYPDLARQGVTIQLKREGRTWLLSVAEAPSSQRSGEATAPATPAPVLLHGTIAFDAQGRLEGYQAEGPYLHRDANAVLRDAVRTHPRWIESDADVELMKLGGRSVIGEPFTPVAAPDTARMGSHLGAAITKGAPRFTLRATAPDGATPIVTAVWLVETTASDGSGPPVHYQFTYEPIGGRLIGVTKTGGGR